MCDGWAGAATNRPHVRATVTTARAYHASAERPDRRFVRQMIGIHLGVVIAMDRTAIDEQIAAAMAADVAQGHGLESLSFAGLHRFSRFGHCA